MLRRFWFLPIVWALACNPTMPAAVQPKEPRTGEFLYLQEGSKIRVRDAVTGEVRAEAPSGLISPDWKTVYTLANVARYSADAPEGRTTVLAMDLFGETLRSFDLPGEFHIATPAPGKPAGLSANGRTLVLPQRQGSSPTATRFAVLDTSFESPAKYVDLPGPFSFDALSPDGKTLYLIEHAAGDAYAYRVRRYVLATSALDPQPVVLKGANPHELMQGSPAAQVTSPSGEWVYTLYSNYQKGPFIHALQTNGNGIACINLGSDWRTDERHEADATWSLALSPDGGTLYAANAASGLAASIDVAKHFGVIRRTSLPRPSAGWFTVPLAEAKPHVRGGVAVSPDGSTLYAIGRKGLTVLTARDLSLRKTLLSDRALTSVAVSPDGERFYVAGMGGDVLRLDAGSGAVFGALSSAPGYLLRVGEG